MKTKTKILIAIPLFIIAAALIASVVLNVIILQKLNDFHIMDYTDMGLISFMTDEVTEMYVDEVLNPNLKCEFYDEEVLASMREIISSGCFQRTDAPNHGSAPGSGASTYIKFTTENGSYTFGSDGVRLYVTVDGEKTYYYSDVTYKIDELMYGVLKKELPEHFG